MKVFMRIISNMKISIYGTLCGREPWIQDFGGRSNATNEQMSLKTI